MNEQFELTLVQFSRAKPLLWINYGWFVILLLVIRTLERKMFESGGRTTILPRLTDGKYCGIQ